MSHAIHYAYGKGTACGLERHNGVLVVSSHKVIVNCPECKATQPFAHARQRLPEVRSPLYRG
jgi:hypothetical protein